MKKAILFVVALVIVAIGILIWLRLSNSNKSAALSPANTIVRIYFTGAANLAADTNSPGFTNIFCSSQAHALESQTLDKLSHAPGGWFKDKLPAGVADGSAQLRPLLDDFLKSEWVFQMRDAAASPEYALAIKLNDARAQLWQTNLRTLLESWTGIKATDIAGGWQLKKDMPPNLFRIVRTTNDWLIVGCGQDELPVSDAWASGALIPVPSLTVGAPPETNGPPRSLTVGAPSETNASVHSYRVAAPLETNWLSANVNWPRLAQIFPVFAKFGLPKMQLAVVGQKGELLPSGTFELSQPLPALPDWQIPSDMIHGRLTSFTAVRGFAPWLEKQPWAKWLQISPEPNQAFSWSVGEYPIESYLAVPVSNSITALSQLAQNITADTNWEKHLLYTVPLERTNDRIALGKIPFFVSPEVRAITDPSGDYLLADFFPNLPGPQPPEALLQKMNRDNLVAYHWEVTPARLKDLPHLTQLALMLTKHRQVDAGSPAGQWLARITPALGDSVTEVTQTGASELSFRRSAPAGLTAIELMALTEWLEAPNFPGCDMSLPPPVIPKHRPHKKMPMPKPQTIQLPAQHLLGTNIPPPHPQNSNPPPATIKK